jgi:hypothetical protein
MDNERETMRRVMRKLIAALMMATSMTATHALEIPNCELITSVITSDDIATYDPMDAQIFGSAGNIGSFYYVAAYDKVCQPMKPLADEPEMIRDVFAQEKDYQANLRQAEAYARVNPTRFCERMGPKFQMWILKIRTDNERFACKIARADSPVRKWLEQNNLTVTYANVKKALAATGPGGNR